MAANTNRPTNRPSIAVASSAIEELKQRLLSDGEFVPSMLNDFFRRYGPFLVEALAGEIESKLRFNSDRGASLTSPLKIVVPRGGWVNALERSQLEEKARKCGELSSPVDMLWKIIDLAKQQGHYDGNPAPWLYMHFGAFIDQLTSRLLHYILPTEPQYEMVVEGTSLFLPLRRAAELTDWYLDTQPGTSVSFDGGASLRRMTAADVDTIRAEKARIESAFQPPKPK